MSEFDLTAMQGSVDFGATETAEILQNVRTIISTPKFSVPLDRNFGLSAMMLDAPLPVAQAKLTSEIITAIHKYEPRVRVTRIMYEQDAQDGILRPKVRVRIVDV